ncbi:MAG TPA: NAD(+)/NADH kinase [Steroidobacteraceae bacterium]|jgi:NAD+ kinase|nr:NAD(+)/NADH kinase [Steroidobacteraceae bacterium]
MDRSIRTCALIGKFQDARVAECALPLVQTLQSRGLAILALDDVSSRAVLPDAVARIDVAELTRRADLVIAIGGDGTLLYAAGLVAEHGIPLLGINRGRLGFLTDVLPQDLGRSMDAVLAGECVADRRSLLQARLYPPTGAEVAHFALNDVVFNRLDTGRMLDFETRIDGRYVNSGGGDGLVVATATGSTAYALSCGGPIVDPRLSILVVAPICPHTLSDRPIVVPGDSTVEIRLIGHQDSVAQVTCDASVLGELRLGGRLEISPSERAITLLHPPGYDFFRLLRSKLHWGRGGLSHER